MRILIVGESWVSASTHYKGFDQFGSASYHTGADPLIRVLEADGMEVEFQPSHVAATAFPLTLAGLQQYDVIWLSDIGANTLLLHPDTWLHGQRVANRLKLIEEYVRLGGGLGMAGGYLSFQGINGSARYHRTPVEAVLPVTILPVDDRVEVPEGVTPSVVLSHPIVEGLDGEWPFLLGYNELRAKPGSETLLTLGADPLLVLGRAGAGRSLAWASDIGPHWCPQAFLDWPGYAALFTRMTRWLAGALP